MLGKLLKYEMKAGLRLLPIVYLGMVSVFLVGLLAKAIGISQIQFAAALLLAVGGVAAVLMTLVLVILRCFKGLFGTEGYLTQTLPVGKGTLLLSKVIAAYVWMLVSVLGAAAAFVGCLWIGGADLRPIWEMVFGSGTRGWGALLFYVAAVGAAQLLTFLGELYFAVTLANTRPFLRNNTVFSVLFFFITNFIVSLLELAGMLLIPLGIHIGESGAEWVFRGLLDMFGASHSGNSLTGLATIGLGGVFVDAAAGVALLLIARWLLAHKTSVK